MNYTQQYRDQQEAKQLQKRISSFIKDLKVGTLLMATEAFFSIPAVFLHGLPAFPGITRRLHCGYFSCEAWGAKGKIPIGALTDLVSEARCQLMTEKFPVGSLPLFASPAKAQIDRMVVQQVRCLALPLASVT